jgi:hypothetical protein
MKIQAEPECHNHGTKKISFDNFLDWQKFLTAVPYKFNVFYFLIMCFIYEIHRNIFILRS